MKIIIDIEEDDGGRWLKEFVKSYKTGACSGEIKEEFIKFKWRGE
jgi:hypothetical protein